MRYRKRTKNEDFKMSTLNLSHHEIPTFLQRLGDVFHAFFAGLQDARLQAHRFETLSRLSDAQLAARGLKREDIPQTVFASTRS
jgi:hypothetical protein